MMWNPYLFPLLLLKSIFAIVCLYITILYTIHLVAELQFFGFVDHKKFLMSCLF